MFLRILKRDLKRKKTMNIILLLFMIMSAMFAAASISNIAAVTGGIDSYFDKARVPDLMMSTPYDSDIGSQASELPSVKSVRAEHQLTVLDSGCFSLNGHRFDNFTNIARLLNDSERGITYFGENNEELAPLKKGEFYASYLFINGSGLREGDTVELKVGDTELSLVFKGRMKPAVYDQSSTGFPILLLNAEDFKTCEKDPAFYGWSEKMLFIETSDPEGVADKFEGIQNVWSDTREERKSIYLYDMIAAYLMMVISIVLILTCLVMLRFTIGFTISEEFREIGVMKAVGISSGKIRRLYIIKYLAVSVIGAVSGFFCSIPLSSAMLENISKNMVFDSGSTVTNGLISSALIIILIVLFSYLCTRRIKKLSPIDAVRSGQTGERFGKKSIMHLGRSKLPATGFMACNDILSAPKQFILMTVIFTLCILLMTSISNFAETIKSDSIIGLFGVGDTDITIGDVSSLEDVFAGKGMGPTVEKFDRILEENNIPGKSSISVGAQYKTFCGGRDSMITYLVSKGAGSDSLTVDEGTMAVKPDEVVMTRKALDDLGAEIGDRVKLTIGGIERELIITGQFSSFMGGGNAARLCSEYEYDPDKITNTFGVQVQLTGSRDKETIDHYVQELRKVFNTEKVYSNSEMAEIVTGMSSTLTSIKQMMMILTVIVTILIAVLMERSFISKEKSEIALMKAIGISSGAVIRQHTMRFGITAVFAAVIASAVTLPLSSVMVNAVFNLIGDIKNISADFNALEIFLICPLILIGSAVFGALMTALCTRTVKASDTASIE